MKFAKLLTGLFDPEDPPSGSFLASWEARAVQRIVTLLPQRVSAELLTKLSLAGALLAASGLVGCRFSAWTVALVPLGVALNWFGAAVDGPLSAHRGEQGSKRRWMEHLADLVSLLIVIVAYGFSPFLSLVSSLLIMACFLLFSAYSFLRAAAGRAVQTALLGIGAMEFRIVAGAWPFLAVALGLKHSSATGFERMDFAILMLSIVAIISLVINIILDGRKISSSQI
ncbi:hypothetical protein [Methylocystis bryophila]|uniref:CDP-alcohol phosphatidyltransferase n=1 Tax=Methylocystis bryophila TaxID=655015 RepID=A0A1W6MZ47_9HYPH|nr:hypothetical protein [Methylocystis bryophila]ARN82861.1 hypothetical protein B1812_19235 [Methylocystis bryophila]BDV39125.1 hypothetical protein DSM21852_23780 [Methylocystis bryophila]